MRFSIPSRHGAITINSLDSIYTIKTRLKYICVYVYMCIYMFICTELIEESGRPPGLIFGMWGYFSMGRTSSSFGKKFTHLTEL